MDIVSPNIPSWIGGFARPASWSPESVARKAAAEPALKVFQLTTDESQRFIRMAAECGRIRSHYEIFRWLSGEVQHFLPHDILLSAWGDYAKWELKLDLASALPGVRTAQLAHCSVDVLIRKAYGRWVDAGRQPAMLKGLESDWGARGCECPVHAALRGMSSAVVHGVHDKRSGHDSLFITFSRGSFTRGRSMQRFLSILEPLVAQIDSAFRKVPAFALASAAPRADGGDGLDLSAREHDVLQAMCKGHTNTDIAAVLDISPFTVKNHVQRIFRKLCVTNRTQAAARYAEVTRLAKGG